MNIKFVEVQCIGNTNQININSAKDLVDLLCDTLCVSPLGYRLHNLAEDIRAAAAKETTELDSESISSPDGTLDSF